LIAILPGQIRRRRIARMGAQLVFRLTGTWPKISGLHRLPDTAAVVVANHASYLDGILLTAVLPHRYQFVIKREMTDIPLVHFFLRRIGAHFVERYDPHRGGADARRIMQTAGDGASLAFFPEGTFTREPGLGHFHNGAFTIATRSRMPLIPMTIIGTRRMLPADSWLPNPATLKVVVSEPLDTGDQPDAFAALEHCRQKILEALDEPDLLASGQNLATRG
jgi:1-acyl-sn-glycerol-3-phosphate acyltransferase